MGLQAARTEPSEARYSGYYQYTVFGRDFNAKQKKSRLKFNEFTFSALPIHLDFVPEGEYTENIVKGYYYTNKFTRNAGMTMRRKLFFSLYYSSPLIPMGLIYISNPDYYGMLGNFIPMMLGAMAFSWLNLQLILAARPKRIESAFGLDRLFLFHGLMAIAAICIAFTHKLIKELVFSESLKTQLSDAAIIIFIIAGAMALVFIIDSPILNIKPVHILRAFAKKIVVGKYHIQMILHNLNAAAAVLVFIHVMLTYSANNPLVKAVYILYFGAAMGFYLYHKIIRRYFLSKKYLLADITQDSPLMWTLTLRPENGQVFSYLPGQFGFLRLLGQGISKEAHPFSFSSQPLNRDYITMTIKNLGDWTADIRNIKPGCKALIDAPYGRFSPLLYPCEEGIVLIAGGVGITPMLGILRYYYESDKNQKITLIWGVNDGSDLICKNEFEAFEKEMSRYRFIPVMAKDKSFSGEQGFITREKLERFLSPKEHKPDGRQYFVCGPGVMQRSVLKSLKTMGIQKSHIHYESFSL